jgi:hypothetical protein
MTIEIDVNAVVAGGGGGGGASDLDDLTDVVIVSPSTGQVLKYNGTSWVNDTDVSGGGGGVLNDLTDVVISSAATGDILRWNGTAWVDYPDSNYATSGHNHSGTYEPAGTVATHTSDTSAAHAASAISYAGSTNLSATDVEGALDELDYLKASTSHSHNLNSLDDVVITGVPSTGQVIKYDGNNWINDTDATGGGSGALNDLSDVVITAGADGDILRHNGTAWVDTPGTTHYEAAGAVSTHSSDTTAVHGIADTSALLDTGDIGVSVQGYSAVLAATTASFLTADETKLDGIEAGADVTDAINVAAAGAVMEADTSTASMSFVIDEDNMASNSATKVPTQQSVKAYADTKAASSHTHATVVTLAVTDPNGDAITTGDGKAYFIVPSELNGRTITAVHAGLTTVSSSGTPTIQLHNVTDSVDVLSTAVTIDASEFTSYTAATAPVVNTSNDDLATGDRLRVDVDVAGTGAKGLQVMISVSA